MYISNALLRKALGGYVFRFGLAMGLLFSLLFSYQPSLTSASSQASSAPAFMQSGRPLSFTPNQGQTDPSVAFQAQGEGASLFFTSSEVVMVLPPPGSAGSLPPALRARAEDLPAAPAAAAAPVVARLAFVGANPSPAIAGGELLPGVVNYFLGKVPDGWHTNLPSYASLVYQNLYPGIDLRYESAHAPAGQSGLLKGTYVVAPGADPSLIQWRYRGAAVTADTQGNLHIALSGAAESSPKGSIPTPALPKIELVEQAPVTWQGSAAQRVAVTARYAVAADGTIGFDLPQGYDRTQPLYLDPALVYSTYLGGGGEDNGSGIVVDATGMYITGLTVSTDFPTAGNPVQGSNGGGYEAYVLKLTPDGSALLYSTYLGGSGTDYGLALAVDSSHNAIVTGLTDSPNFPTSAGAYDTTCGATTACVPDLTFDAFVSKLNSTGSQLLYSSYLGGDGLDIGQTVAVDGSGLVYVGGRVDSTNFPTAGTPYQSTNAGSTDGFVSKLNTSLAGAASLVYSTYLGGSGIERVSGMAVDAAGSAYLVGRTDSTDFPTAGTPFQSANAGSYDVYVTKLNPTGSALLYSTYLGGSGDDRGFSLALDSDNQVYITGQTASADFPTSAEAFDKTCGSDGICNGGVLDAFVAKLDLSASGAASLVYATYFGGASEDSAEGIAVDSSDEAYITGYTDSTDLPVKHAIQSACGLYCSSGFTTAFITHFDEDGSELRFSTFLGGTSSDYGIALTVDAAKTIYVTGETYSSDFPLVNPLDNSWAGDYDTFVARLAVIQAYLPFVNR